MRRECSNTPGACPGKTLEEIRDVEGVVRFAGEVNAWPPSVDAARPPLCRRCGQPACEGGRKHIHGNGQRRRLARGPPDPCEPAAARKRFCRRYECQACGAVVIVVPADTAPRKHFTGAAIAMALALWGLCRQSAAQVRRRVNDRRQRGFGAPGWRSLARWAGQIEDGELFAPFGLRVSGDPLDVARRAAQALCGWAPPGLRRAPLEHQAFAGACHVG